MEKVTRENLAEHLLKYQLDMVGKNFDDAMSTENWYTLWTMTTEEHQAFKRYAIPLIKKTLKCNKGKAESTFAFFDLQFGLRVSDKKFGKPTLWQRFINLFKSK